MRLLGLLGFSLPDWPLREDDVAALGAEKDEVEEAAAREEGSSEPRMEKQASGGTYNSLTFTGLAKHINMRIQSCRQQGLKATWTDA